MIRTYDKDKLILATTIEQARALCITLDVPFTRARSVRSRSVLRGIPPRYQVLITADAGRHLVLGSTACARSVLANVNEYQANGGEVVWL